MKSVKWFARYLIIAAIRWIVLLLPRKAALKLGVFLANQFFRFSHREKAIALDNLSIAFNADGDSESILSLCQRCFQNLGKSFMEALQIPRLNAKKLDKIVAISGKQNLDEALNKGNGVIILTAHFGNWELMAVSLAIFGYNVNQIVRPLHSRHLDAMLNQNRERMGTKSIPRGASIRNAVKCLKRNELLIILPDIDTKVNGVFVDFFGRPAFTPNGPASFALRTGAALVPVFMVRQKDNTHKLIIEKALELETTGELEKDIKVNTSKLTRVIETYIRKNPEQWIWIHQRWKTQPDEIGRESLAHTNAR